MKKSTLTKLSIVVAVVAVLMIAFALQTDNALAYTSKSPNVRFTIDNNSQHSFHINLYGPAQYSFDVPPKSKRSWYLPRATYSFSMEACNHTSSGTLNLKIYQTMYVPVCGGTAGPKGDRHHAVDTSDYIKPVRIKIRNMTREPIHLYLRTIENHYYVDLDPREITTLVVLRGYYVYSYVACGELEAGYYQSVITPPLDLVCSDK